MKKLICLLLAMVMVMAVFAGCNNTPAGTEPGTDPTVETITIESNMTSFSLNWSMDATNMYQIVVYEIEGEYFIQYWGDIRKEAQLSTDDVEGIKNAFATSGLHTHNGAEEYVEGEAMASLFVSFDDETMYTANYSGVLPETFVYGCNAIDAYVQQLLADVPEYVPMPTIADDVDADHKAALLEILSNSGLQNLDNVAAMNAQQDLAITLGLTSDEGITAGTACSFMITGGTPFYISLVTVEDAANIEAVRADFEANINWEKGVCVIATDALIAHKDNLVILLLSSDEMYSKTAASIEAAGWMDIETFQNPLA